MKALPSLDELADSFKCFSVESFRKVASPLFFPVNFYDVDLTILHMTSEKVPLHKEVFCSVGNALFGGEKERSVVIFKDAATYGRLEFR